jgi:hypothetical protein
MFSSELARSRSAEAFQHALRICGRRGDEVGKGAAGSAPHLPAAAVLATLRAAYAMSGMMDLRINRGANAVVCPFFMHHTLIGGVLLR